MQEETCAHDFFTTFRYGCYIIRYYRAIKAEFNEVDDDLVVRKNCTEVVPKKSRFIFKTVGWCI